ncbi:MAG: response regulator [Flavobacteriales bacterium]|nr:response regulator [Flavobacteriales bacterium]
MSEDQHRLLRRQLRKFFGDGAEISPELQAFIEAVDQSYKHHESDRQLIERAMELSSKELTESNKKLLEESKKQKVLIDSLKDSLRSISSSNLITDDHDLLKIADLLSIEIEQRKRAEAQIIASEEKYRGIIENMNLGMLETDNNGVVVNVYDRFLTMTGYTADEVLGKDPKEVMLPEGAQQIMRSQEAHRKTGEYNVYELQIRRKDGELIWVIVSAAPIFAADGSITGSLGIHFDITHRKQIESDLEIAKATAEASLKSKDLFLANISHEIRTPMNAIIGMSRLLSETPLNSSQKEYLRAISTSAQGLLVIINDVLDMSKIQSGKFTMETIDVDLEHQLKTLEQTFQFKAEDRGIYFQVIQDKSLYPFVQTDPTRLNQVLTNLVSNALKFTTVGGVTLTVKKLNSGKDSADIEFSVKDTGIGIDKEKLNAIFESFTQEDSTITRKYGGTGLGLAISRQLVELLGGELFVESEKGKGSVFRFVLHLPNGTPLKKERKQSTELTSLDGMKVLLVEDNEINQFLAVTILKRWNTLVETASNGLEAIEFAKKQTFDVILMDMQMPEMDGIEATRYLRAELKIQTPIIALTANAVKGEQEKCIEAGMNDYLSKPFDQDVLFEKLANCYTQPTPVQKKASASHLANPSGRFSLKKLNKMYNGEIQFVRRTVEIFLSQFQADMARLNEALASENLEGIEQMAHKIKPNIDLFDIAELKEDVRQIELQAHAGKLEGLEFKIKRLDQVMSEVGEEMGKSLN